MCRHVMAETYVLNEGTLVLEGVTLAQVVELVVEVLVDLAGSTVLDQQAAEDTELAHPLDLAVGICQSQSFPTTDVPQKIFQQSSILPRLPHASFPPNPFHSSFPPV